MLLFIIVGLLVSLISGSIVNGILNDSIICESINVWVGLKFSVSIVNVGFSVIRWCISMGMF